jgi:hypothetical protein
MSTPTPDAPTPGTSPLVERIDSDTEYLHITPTFGGLLKVAQFGTHGPGASMEGAVAAVTVYGDGRIEYHPVQVDGGAA